MLIHKLYKKQKNKVCKVSDKRKYIIKCYYLCSKNVLQMCVISIYVIINTKAKCITEKNYLQVNLLFCYKFYCIQALIK